jgi:hypothetical protein
LDSGFHYLDSGVQIGRGFRIPENCPKIRVPDSSDVWVLDSTVWIPDCKAIKIRIFRIPGLPYMGRHLGAKVYDLCGKIFSGNYHPFHP